MPGAPVCLLGALAVAGQELRGQPTVETPVDLMALDRPALTAVRGLLGRRASGYWSGHAIADWADGLRVARRRRAVRVLRRAAARCRRG